MTGLQRGSVLGLLVGAGLLLPGCLPLQPQPMARLNGLLEQAGPSRDPSLAGRWLALIAARGGREQVELIDVERGHPLPLPGLNRADAQPIGVSVDASGECLAVVWQRQGTTELVLYRRSVASLQLLDLRPAAVPRRVQLRADGRQLAVEVSRQGVWQIDLIDLP